MFIDQVLTLERKKILLPSNLLVALTIEAHKRESELPDPRYTFESAILLSLMIAALPAFHVGSSALEVILQLTFSTSRFFLLFRFHHGIYNTYTSASNSKKRRNPEALILVILLGREQ